MTKKIVVSCSNCRWQGSTDDLKCIQMKGGAAYLTEWPAINVGSTGLVNRSAAISNTPNRSEE